MILKKMYEDYDLAIERILIKEYKRLKLSMQEMSVLLALFSIYKRRKTFSIASISRRVEFNQNEIGTCVESLMNKGFMSIILEKKDGREREIFDLDTTFKKIEDLYINDEVEKLKQLHENEISGSIKAQPVVISIIAAIIAPIEPKASAKRWRIAPFILWLYP